MIYYGYRNIFTEEHIWMLWKNIMVSSLKTFQVLHIQPLWDDKQYEWKLIKTFNRV